VPITNSVVDLSKIKFASIRSYFLVYDDENEVLINEVIF